MQGWVREATATHRKRGKNYTSSVSGMQEEVLRGQGALQPFLPHPTHLSSIALLMSHFQRGVGGQLGNLPLRQELNASYKDDSKIDQKNIHSPLS